MVKSIVITLIAIPVLLMAFTAFAFLYNYNFHSLARLKNSINVGESYGKVEKKFKKYCAKHEREPELQCGRKVKSMFIYQSSIFDDVQLTVKFNKNKVTKVFVNLP